MMLHFFLFLSVLTISLASQSTSTDDNVFTGFLSSVDMPYAASDMVATTFEASLFSTGDGPRIYITGGCNSDQTCSTTDSYTSCACTNFTNSMIYFTPETLTYHSGVANMLRPRYRHMAAAIGDYLYVAGGRTVPEDTIITQIDRYNVLTDTWELFVDWANATSDGVAFGFGDLLYIVGGYDQVYNSQATMTVINTTTGDFLPAGDYPEMAYPRGDTQIAKLADDEFYVVGGWDSFSADGFCYPSHDVEKYTVSSNTWMTMDMMSYGRGDLAMGVIDNQLFAVGGEQKEAGTFCSLSIPVNLVERFTSSANNWTKEESIPDNLFRFIGATYNSSTSSHSSAIYLFGGQSTFNAEQQIFPIKNTTIIYYPAAIYGGQSNHKKTLSPGGIAGIVIAGIVVLIVLVTIAVVYGGYRYSVYRYHDLKDSDNHQYAAAAPAAAADQGGKAVEMTATNGQQQWTDKELEEMELQENFGTEGRL